MARSEIAAVATAMVVALPLLLIGLGAAGFDDPGEGMHAEIARELLRSGDPLVLTLNGVRYVDNDGHYGSAALFEDILGPFAGRGLIADKVVLDIGSGTGRIVAMLLASGARQVVAVEPSAACDVLRSNVAAHGNRVRCLNVTGDALPEGLVVDSAVSIGVLHHIPEPDPVMRAVHHALKPGGAFVAWLYGREGNGLYLAIVQPLRAVTTRLPHRLLDGLCHILNGVLALYVALARRMPVPMRSYVTEVISPTAGSATSSSTTN